MIGGQRDRYRSIGQGDPAPRAGFEPWTNLIFRLGPPVDPSGVLPDGRPFRNIRAFQDLVAADERLLLTNLARRLTIFGTGREISFADREEIAGIVDRTLQAKGGVRTLIHEVVQGPLFRVH